MNAPKRSRMLPFSNRAERQTPQLHAESYRLLQIATTFEMLSPSPPYAGERAGERGSCEVELAEYSRAPTVSLPGRGRKCYFSSTPVTTVVMVACRGASILISVLTIPPGTCSVAQILPLAFPR